MKSPLFFLSCLVLVIFCLGGIGCEKHPPSETIKDYDAKKAEQQGVPASGHPGAESHH